MNINFLTMKYFFAKPLTKSSSIILWVFYTNLITLLFLERYTQGDLLFYRIYYDNVARLDFIEAYKFYGRMLVSTEPIYFLTSLLAARLVTHDFLMLLLNNLLAFLLGSWLSKQDTPRLTHLLLVGNFYYLVLLLPAERLKLALILLLAAFFMNRIHRLAFFVLALLSHIQTALLIISYFLKKSIFDSRDLLKRFGMVEVALIFIGFCLIVILLGLFLQEHILLKYFYYSKKSFGLLSILKPIFFAGATLFFVSRSKYAEVIAINIPLIIASYLVGSDRIVMFSFIAFIYYGLNAKCTLRPGFIAINSYFLVKGIVFLNQIIINGHGF